MAGKSEESQPDVVWLHSKSLGEERPFSPAHAAKLQALEARLGQPDWLPVQAPSPTPDTTAPAANDPKPRNRSRTSGKPR
ncbi:hypothetical protein [Hymenobacter sp. YC55]|uniref:hypothetical protein n=1 Tax=Hymenobacter sp. YC55 TaxID=3034019 RepID=UPI0023F8ED9C|nr:hypothetical protein [Hymenobacter sp. YC55]MDF7810715.1 hypothetical protein [Hymenobacter sp. YC55]